MCTVCVFSVLFSYMVYIDAAPKVEDSTPAPDKAAICSDKKVSGSENQPLLEVRTYTCLFCLLLCSVYVYT